MLIAFSVTPLGVGEDLGEIVAEAVRVVRASGLPNQTDAMFTTVEGNWVAAARTGARGGFSVDCGLRWLAGCELVLGPNRVRSRALGAITSITLLITPLGALAAGYAVSAVGLDATLLTAGGLYLVVTIVPATHSAWQRLDAPHPDPGQTPEITPTRAGPNVRG
jgi:hypothetical protein